MVRSVQFVHEKPQIQTPAGAASLPWEDIHGRENGLSSQFHSAKIEAGPANEGPETVSCPLLACPRRSTLAELNLKALAGSLTWWAAPVDVAAEAGSAHPIATSWRIRNLLS